VDQLGVERVEFASLANYSVSPPTEASLVRSGKGVTFYYHGGNAYVTIAESDQPGFSFHGFNLAESNLAGVPVGQQGGLPPEGEMLVLNRGRDWAAQLREDRVYLEINATTKALLLTAARALTPAP
jgi:hypothetical protein